MARNEKKRLWLLRVHNPNNPCMVYLPTFTIKINQMEVYIPYMDPMGKGKL